MDSAEKIFKGYLKSKGFRFTPERKKILTDMSHQSVVFYDLPEGDVSQGHPNMYWHFGQHILEPAYLVKEQERSLETGISSPPPPTTCHIIVIAFTIVSFENNPDRVSTPVRVEPTDFLNVVSKYDHPMRFCRFFQKKFQPTGKKFKQKSSFS